MRWRHCGVECVSMHKTASTTTIITITINNNTIATTEMKKKKKNDCCVYQSSSFFISISLILYYIILLLFFHHSIHIDTLILTRLHHLNGSPSFTHHSLTRIDLPRLWTVLVFLSTFVYTYISGCFNDQHNIFFHNSIICVRDDHGMHRDLPKSHTIGCLCYIIHPTHPTHTHTLT